uniref:SFRICE_014721 n=1 Tax=Spodoptera frugiperda TaxID=7108 RepID=A0A2H1V1Q5_SPOFR
MGPSRADARSGAADNVTGYQGSGSKQEKEQGDFNFGVKLGAKQNRSRVVYKLLIERKPTLLLDATPDSVLSKKSFRYSKKFSVALCPTQESNPLARQPHLRPLNQRGTSLKLENSWTDLANVGLKKGLHIRESPKGPVEYQRKALSCTC